MVCSDFPVDPLIAWRAYFVVVVGMTNGLMKGESASSAAFAAV